MLGNHFNLNTQRSGAQAWPGGRRRFLHICFVASRRLAVGNEYETLTHHNLINVRTERGKLQTGNSSNNQQQSQNYPRRSGTKRSSIEKVLSPFVLIAEQKLLMSDIIAKQAPNSKGKQA